MNILGIDPGTNCGWAIRHAGIVSQAGVWDLKPKRHEGAGMRFVKLVGSLRETVEACGVEVIAYEEVRRHMGNDASQVYGGIVASIQIFCENSGIPYMAIPVGTVKKLATGKGNASKDSVLRAANQKWPHLTCLTYDSADASWIAEAAAREIGHGG